MLGSMITFSLGLDLFQGYTMREAWHNAVSPFRVMEVAELFVLYFLLFLLLVNMGIQYYKKGKASN
ncbi:hypothetical protein [Rossellomorea sp. KS-H15a]|uniref:hypothetical protein n=1 Tax=Rossellomorea sp. KS-H15a TaxID=2963940 RepID=UPI0020C70BCD|nr:hypothetical protein [Rossellomorea sp. KS-H15a]UTE78427.1 hypothetical protein M1J35_06580 [Rossellomorea sp. KS-H15a]